MSEGGSHSVDFDVIQTYLPLFREAAWLTVRLGVLGIVIAIAVGLVCAAIQYWRVPVLRVLVAVYIQISRNTPLLIQLFFIYYGLPKIGIRTNPATIFDGADCTATIRAAREAARS